MIKEIIFDLDNTLIDFLKMKKHSCEAAISAMIDAGLKVKKEKALKLLFELYDKHGLENPRIFQKFLKKTCFERKCLCLLALLQTAALTFNANP